MNEIFKLFGTIAIEGVDKAENEINDLTNTARRSENKLISSFKKIGTAVAAAFAVDKIIDFGKEIVSTAATVAAEQSAFAQIMGDYADEASVKLSKIAETTGKVDTALTPYMTSMTAKFKGLGYDIADATDFASRGLYLASDAAAFWDMSLDESVSHLNSFINGSYEGGEAIGLFANDTQMALYALEQGIISDTKAWASLDEATKQATRLQYAENMMKLSGATGQASKEAEQYANVQANLNEKWRQFKALIGQPILQNIVTPAMQKLCDVIDGLTEAYQNASKWVEDNQDKVNNWKGILIGATTAVGTFLLILNWGEIMAAASAALDLVTGAIKRMTMAIQSNPIGFVISLITGLIAYLVYLYNTNEEFRAFVDSMLSEIWAKLQVVIAWIQENILPVIQPIIAWIQENVIPVIEEVITWIKENAIVVIQEVISWIQNTMIPAIQEVIAWIQTNVIPAIQTVIEWIKTNVIPVIQEVIAWIQTNVIPVVQEIIAWIQEKLSAFWAWIGEIFSSGSSTVGGIWETIKGFFLSAWETIQGVWAACQPFFDGIWNGIILPVWGLIQEMIGAFQMAWDVIVLVWGYAKPYFMAIWEGIKAVFSVVAIVLGTFFKNAWEAIKFVWDMVAPYFSLLWDNIKAVFSVATSVLSGFFTVAWSVIKAVWSTAVAFFTLVWAGIKAVFAVVKGVLSGNFSDAWAAIKNVWDKAKNYFQTLWDGIVGIFKSVGSAIVDVFKTAWQAVKDVFASWGEFFGSLFENIKETFINVGQNIADAVGGAVKTAINGIIGTVENTINGGIGLINGAIKLANLLPGVNVSTLGEISLPRLAKGGIVDRPTVAEIGENGAEAIVPLERNTEWIDRVADKVTTQTQGQLGNTSNESVVERLDKVIELLMSLTVNITEDTLEAILDSLSEVSENIRAGQTIKIGNREFARTVKSNA